MILERLFSWKFIDVFTLLNIYYYYLFRICGRHMLPVHVSTPNPNPDMLQQKLNWIIRNGSEFCKWRERKRLVLVLFGVSSVKRTRKANHPPPTQRHTTQTVCNTKKVGVNLPLFQTLIAIPNPRFYGQ